MIDVVIVNDQREHRLVTYLPADDASTAALDRAIADIPARPVLRVIDRDA